MNKIDYYADFVERHENYHAFNVCGRKDGVHIALLKPKLVFEINRCGFDIGNKLGFFMLSSVMAENGIFAVLFGIFKKVVITVMVGGRKFF